MATQATGQAFLKKMSLACFLLAGAAAASLTGIYLLSKSGWLGSFSQSILCYLVACSELVLAWQSLRAARGRVPHWDYVAPASLSGLCLILHMWLFPWTLFLKCMGATPFVDLVLGFAVFGALWSVPVWLVLMIGLAARVLRRTPEYGRGEASPRSYRIVQALRRARLGLVPVAVVAVMLVARELHGRLTEWVLVSRHSEARVVREYLDALAARDYLGMSRKLMVLRYFKGSRGAEWLPGVHPQDFEGRIDLQEQFAINYCREMAEELEKSFFCSTARILEARPFLKYECEGGQEPTYVKCPGRREVVVEVRYHDGTWHRQYLIVWTEGYEEPRICGATCLPHAAPEGCCPVPGLARPIGYETALGPPSP